MEDEAPNRELYARLHLSPDASKEDIRRAYRQWAQVYHPDKHRSPQMQDVATENFQHIREAYEILSDEQKRQVYDVYGMEGLNSGLELGPKLKTREEVQREFDRLRQQRQEQKIAAHVNHSGSLLVNISIAELLKSFSEGPIVTGMSSSTQVQSHISKNDTLILGGSMLIRGGAVGGSVNALLRRQTSPVSSVEVLAMAGLRSLFTVQTSRQLSTHSTGTLGISVSLIDGSINVANTWTRQLSESTIGNIQLVVGPDAAVAIGWQRQGKQNSGTGEIKLAPASFGVSGQYIHQFSTMSRGRISGKFGSTALEVELGGERRISEHSTLAMFCTLGVQGVLWKFRFTRGGQKFTIPVLLSATLNPFIASGALILPSFLYALLKTYVVKPYYLRRKHRKSQEQRRLTINELHEGIKKSGLMGFCDPCPGEEKRLKVVYTYRDHQYQVVVNDYDELFIPQEAHKQSSGCSSL
eukprot:c27340_g2_i2 orf=73-1476(+)